MSKEIALAYANRIWNKKDLKAIDELLDENVIIHSLLGNFYGRETMKNVVDAWLKGFPDLEVENQLVLSEQDHVIIHWKAKGTHLGEFKATMPTGKQISYAGVTIYRINKNKIIEYWAYLDMHHILNQIKS